MTRRTLLIAEHVLVHETCDQRSPVIGQTRRRRSPSGRVDFWEVRRTAGDWYGKFDQETAYAESKEKNYG